MYGHYFCRLCTYGCVSVEKNKYERLQSIVSQVKAKETVKTFIMAFRPT